MKPRFRRNKTRAAKMARIPILENVRKYAPAIMILDLLETKYSCLLKILYKLTKKAGAITAAK